jgi:hypothetical protein
LQHVVEALLPFFRRFVTTDRKESTPVLVRPARQTSDELSPLFPSQLGNNKRM